MLDISHTSKSNKFRKKRIEILNEMIAQVVRTRGTCRIIDIGGTLSFWDTWKDEIDWSHVSIVCINLSEDSNIPSDLNVKCEKMNACDLSSYSDNQFDIAFSNSVVEHVGLWKDMKQMADELQRVARWHLVQTPNFWFPIEPHARFPFLHWLPESWSYRIVLSRKCGFWKKATTVSEAVNQIQSAKLIDKRQMKELFPESELIVERFIYLPKSFIAIRRS